MSSAVPVRSSGVFASSDLFHLTVVQYHEMMDAGILTADDRVELLEGVLVKKTSVCPPHTGTVRMLCERFYRCCHRNGVTDPRNRSSYGKANPSPTV